MSRTPQEELVHFLSDIYSVELQAIAQLDTAPGMAEDPGFSADLRTHLVETERQADLVRARLEAHGGSPSTVKDAIMKIGGKGFLLFAKLQLETPGRLLAHSYSYEAMEWAGYDVLARMADFADDAETARIAREIQDEERTMMQRLEKRFDAVEALAHADLSAEDLDKHVSKHLAEAHALKVQTLMLIGKASDIAGHTRIAQLYAALTDDCRGQLDNLQDRVEALGAEMPVLQDAALALGALNWGLFFQSQKDTPAKLLAFTYALFHLEIGGQELLLRTARRANDTVTAGICESILAEERAMVPRIAEQFDLAVQSTFTEVGEEPG